MSTHVCKNCGHSGESKFCSNCGQSYSAKRITLSHLLEEVFHFFTHFEKGFGYTLKQLILAPGIMQKQYLEGHRMRFQKPFSMFFISATVCGLGEYWINYFVAKQYNASDQAEIYFFQHYFVIEHVLLMPVYAFVTWLFFIGFKYNYAEILVVLLYLVSIFFILVVLITALKFIWPHLDTKYIELPVLTAYNLITLINLFQQYPRWKIVTLSCISVVINYTLVQVIQSAVISRVENFA